MPYNNNNKDTLGERFLENLVIARQHGPSHMLCHGAQRSIGDVSWLEVQLQIYKLYNLHNYKQYA